ncbi:hypothetical protein [Chryseobacterium herbae]|uniref:Bacteriocin-type signal sequence-containing protein n=1 Tax=Chryseobacterium herbae TaxID=2976476 RepID=A0ABT2IUE4_9FLAO|nr:hypothetical protein [Chryseobacterium sp. pc1-10]MCT2562463.1 hypothetical protein [Chryseobacterium sp. pc1-10]
MKTNARKLNREELKNLKGGGPIRDRVCCTSNEDGFCCEWAINMENCHYINC